MSEVGYQTYYINSSNRGYYINNSDDTGRQGFQRWECYMLLKYGNAGRFGLGGRSEYLIELPFYPDEVQETISATWTEQSVIGRSSPLAAYAGTSLKSVSFSIDLHRDMLTGSYSLTNENIKEIANEKTGGNTLTVLKNQVAGNQFDYTDGLFGGRDWFVNINKMLQMSCYPQYTDAGAIPPTTYFIFGQAILKGFVETYSVTWKKPVINTFYGCNTTSISMKCYPDSVVTAHDLISGDTSTQNTYSTVFPSSAGGRGGSNVMDRNFGRETKRSGSLTDVSIKSNVINT